MWYSIKESIWMGVAAVCGLVAAMLGGWDTALTSLLLCMAADYVTGVIVAAVFQRSRKTESGALSSKAGFTGLLKKGVTLLIVMVAFRVEQSAGVPYIREAAIFAFMANEVVSLIENAGLMGVPVPAVVTKAIDLLKNRANETDETR